MTGKINHLTKIIKHEFPEELKDLQSIEIEGEIYINLDCHDETLDIEYIP